MLDLWKMCEVMLIDKKRYFEYVSGTSAAFAGAASLSLVLCGDLVKKCEKMLMVLYSKVFGKSVVFECVVG